MASDWRYDMSISMSITTLPSVAELLASSHPPATDTAYHRLPATVPPTYINRPTNLHSRPAKHPRPHAHSTTTSLPQLSSEPLSSVFVAAHSTRPSSYRRQGTNMSYHTDAPKHAVSTSPLPGLTISPPTQAPSHGRTSLSPTTRSQPSAPTSPRPPARRRPSLHLPPLILRPTHNRHTQSLSLSSQMSTEASQIEWSSNTTTRPPRFNVRFMANYTSENMPPSHKPRAESASAHSTTVDAVQPQTTVPDLAVTASVEQAVSPAASIHSHVGDPAQAQPRRRETSVERCPGCNEVWKRPLPNPDQFRHSSPAENNADYSRATQNILTHLVDHAKKADAAHARWQWRHSHCIAPAEHDLGPLTPPTTEPQDDAHTTSSATTWRDGKPSDAPSNKRKSAVFYDQGYQPTSKVRKVDHPY